MGPPDVPSFVTLAAHPLRWRLLTALAAGDYRVRELTRLAGEPQNLVSYHLRQLRAGGLVTARRSSFDARDSYYQLDLDRCADALAAIGAALHPALRMGTAPPASLGGRRERPRVLFACTGNSARSPIAEALLRHRSGGHVDVLSAGSHPRPQIDPRAVRVLSDRFGIDITGQRPRHLDAVDGRRFDRVITLCDTVREVRPDVSGHSRSAHWSIPDPAAGPDDQIFGHIAAQIDTRVRHLLPALATTDGSEVPP